MQLKSFFPQDDAGNLLTGGTATVYLKGTQTLATGLADAAGNPVANPVPAAESGRIQFRAPMGDYDVLLEAEGLSLQVEASFMEAGDVVSIEVRRGVFLTPFEIRHIGRLAYTTNNGQTRLLTPLTKVF